MSKLMLVAGLALAFSAGAATATAQEPLRLGSAVSGSLATTDETLDGGEYQDTYTFRGRANQRIAVRLRSDAFDPYVMIRGPGGFSEDNDDESSAETNSLLVISLPADGVYRISATSYATGATGPYEVLVEAGEGVETAQDDSVDGILTLGQSARGRLESGDDLLDSGEYRDAFTLSGRRGQSFDLSLRSTDFDSYLMVRGPGGLNEDNDDDTERGSRDSRLSFTLTEDGEVTVSATSYASGETGAYVLSVNDPGVGEPSPVETSVTGAVRLGQTIDGRLAEGDALLEGGEHRDSYAFTGRRGQRLDLRLASGAFDPYVAITGPDGFSDFNDDDATVEDSRDSRLLVTLPADGDYQITATSYAAGERGQYRLSVLDGVDAEATAPVASESHASGIIAVGDTVSGALGAGDPIFNDGEFYDLYRFEGRRGQRVALDLTSSAFDAFISLLSPSGELITNDDGEDGTNSHLNELLTEDGQYQVRVTSFAAAERGSYRFSLGEGREPARHAAVAGGPRVFAVMVGVSDYEGDHNDLPLTDEDARKLSEALAREGVLNPASIVLTNAEATRDGVRRAFADVARQAGPEDVFMFFFSGHGYQIDASVSRDEPDGRAETLSLHDGDMTDVELGEMFAGLNTRLSLLVIDACFSGGFARNVVDRPGVMGVFSSEEDLTSAVASKFEAGGYLSHFVRAGVTGGADENGDRLVTAGELATYLRREFAREVVNVGAETIDGQRNYQNLVIDRGGVQVEDVVLRFAATGSAEGGR